ncbi:hypothetical protein AQ490_08680 [Wenjunlia vitaminophila]|uniref:Protein kinase domain-containing protein n=1 Tax=Wenjunlia vitaminophila TaxID=76728 RepID=A0A0T6LLM7_WENVI|nr:hypothetical protein AQ490_08680 [Wenjunlia vitaminophila]
MLADRYRLPLVPEGEEPLELPAFDTYSGQEVIVRQVPLPEVVSAEMVFAPGEEPPDVLAPGDDPGQRALRAATAASRIPDHPGLVQVYDLFLEDGGLWIVSEWVPARSLAEEIDERPISPYRAAEIGADILAALRAVHAEGWTHRNVTADTVLLCDDGKAMLTGMCAAAAEEALCGSDPVPDRTAAPGRGAVPGPRQPLFDEAAAGAGDRPDGEYGTGGHPDDGYVDDEYADDGYADDEYPDAEYRDGHPGHGYRAGAPLGHDPHAGHDGVLGHDGPTGGRGFPVSLDAWSGGSAPQEPLRGTRQQVAQERARQARMGLIGPCTERWSPEQAGPVPADGGGAARRHPVGPPSDLWALGALLYRAVQGHPPFPETSAVELVDIVRNEPPAYAEDCGPLRPVVESLLRKNPQDRPGAEEVRGWLRSLIRTAPEPDLGQETVAVPADPHKIVELRRKGEVTRRRRSEKAVVPHGRHARNRDSGGSRNLPKVLVGLVVLLVVGILAFAALFMPEKGGPTQRENRVGKPPGTAGEPSRSAKASTPAQSPSRPARSPSSRPDLSSDFAVHEDPMGFSLALHQDLRAKGETGQGQMWFDDGDDVEMVVVPGRDTTADFGSDVAAYQKTGEPELKRFREADWSASNGLTAFEVGGNPAIQGEFSWMEGHREYFGRNFVMLQDGRYHVVFVYGPDRDREDVSRFFEKAAETYHYTK